MRDEEEIKKINELIESLCENNYSVDKNIPRYLYHFTDIENAISIIQMGFISSRNFAIEKGLMINDNAESDVINKTSEKNKNNVRFYFRPKTPTQYHNEGIKSEHRSYEYSAHCPIPIFLIFSAEKVLSQSNTKFVEKNLALNPLVKKDIKDLQLFDFKKIFHNGSTSERDVIEKRHAEVLIEEKCGLENMEFIACRSLAEKETIMNLLSNQGVDLSLFNFKIDGRNLFYNKSRAYIDFVELEADSIKIGFTNFYTLTAKDEILLKLFDIKSGQIREIQLQSSQCKSGKRMDIREKKEAYEFSILINGRIVYFGKFNNENNLPF